MKKRRQAKNVVKSVIVVLRSLLTIFAGMLGTIAFSSELDKVTRIIIGIGAVILLVFCVLTCLTEDDI